MRNAMIFHGTAGSPDSFWIPWLKRQLEDADYHVWTPQLPEGKDPQLSEWLECVRNDAQFKVSEGTVMVGHSAGSPLILSLLEHATVRISQAILVAGYVTPLGKGTDGMLQPRYDWEKIKKHVQDIYFINADNDPWGCDDREGRIMLDHLGGTLIIKKGEGHMGSDVFRQPYREFPLVKKLIVG